jgi:hypothetical protein
MGILSHGVIIVGKRDVVRFPCIVVGIAILLYREDLLKFVGPVWKEVLIVLPHTGISNGTRTMFRSQALPIDRAKLAPHYPVAYALESGKPGKSRALLFLFTKEWQQLLPIGAGRRRCEFRERNSCPCSVSINMITVPLQSRIATLLFNVEEFPYCREDSRFRAFLS